MLVKTEAAEVLVLLFPERQQVGNVQVAQGAVERAVFVFTAATDGIAGGDHEIHAGLVQRGSYALFKHAHRVVDVPYHRELVVIPGFEVIFE